MIEWGLPTSMGGSFSQANVYACVSPRERERECVCVCVCEREREGERECEH